MKKIDKKMLFAAWSANNPYWVINQAYNIPLRNIFKEVVNFDPQEETNKYGKKEMNMKFLDVLRKERPDYILMFLVGDEFYIETLVKIKEILPKVKIVHWNGDDDIKFYNYTVPYSAFLDYEFISQLQFAKKYDEYKLPWYDVLGADIEKFRPMKVKKKYEVIFIGTPKGDRLKYMRYLLKEKVNFVLAGGGWEDYPEFKKHYLGRIPDEDFVKIINESKINLCFSQNYFSSPHVLERSMVVNACKAFALTEYVDGYFPKFKEGEDFVSFKNEKELLDKINYYLKHEKEREKITERAYKKVRSRFSNQKLFADGFNAIEKDKKELVGIRTRSYLNKRPIYLEKSDFDKGKQYIIKKVEGYEYVAFKHKGYENLPFRDYVQLYSMDLLKKPISICNCFMSSKLIGDYATLDVHFTFKYYDKEYFYKNVDISQFIVRKDYFLKNIDKFEGMYNGKEARFVNFDNTSLLSVPLMRSRKIKKMPMKDYEHVFFPHIDVNLVSLRSQKRLFRDPYIYKLIFYSIFVNPQMMKLLLTHVARRTKHPVGVKISKFFGKYFN